MTSAPDAGEAPLGGNRDRDGDRARVSVPRVLAEDGGHLTAEAVHARAVERGLAAHRASIYRVLDALCDLGAVQRVQAAGGFAFHLLDGGPPHPRTQCDRCGAVVDLPHDLVHALDGLAGLLAGRSGFRLDADRVALAGRSAACDGAP